MVIGGIATALILTSDEGRPTAGSSDDGAEPGLSPLGLKLTAPQGWTSSADGLQVAESPSDIDATSALGPRITAYLRSPDASLADAFEGGVAEVLDVPVTQIAGLTTSGVTIVDEVDGTRFVRAYRLVVDEGRTAVLLLLEAPEVDWPEAEAILVSAVTSS